MRKLLFLLIISLIFIGCSNQNVAEDLVHEEPEIEKEKAVDNQPEVDAKDDVTTIEEEDKEDEEEQPIVYTYLTDKESFSLNKYDTVLFETEKGEITLVGKSFSDNTITLALTYEGELSDLWDNIDPKFRIITDLGDAFTSYSKEPRLSEDGTLYVIYKFENVQGPEIKRFDYKIDYSSNLDPDDYETIELKQNSNEKVDIPGIAKYTSATHDFKKMEDDEKVIDIQNLSYDSETGNLELIADVTYKEDYDGEETTFVYEPIMKARATAQTYDDFYANISKEVILSYNIGTLSHHTPHIRLRLLDFTLYIDLFTDHENNINNMKVINVKDDELLYNQFLFYDLDAIPYLDRVNLPGIENPMEDTQGNIYYDGFYANMTGHSFHEVSEDDRDYRYAEGYRFDTDGFGLFEATLAYSKETEDFSPITFTFIGDDFEFIKEEEVYSKAFKGNVLEEVTISPKDGTKDVAFNLADTKNLTIVVSSKKDGKIGTPTFIIANNILKR